MGRQSRPLTGEAKPQGWPTGAAIRACEFRRSATLCIEAAKGSKPKIWTEASRDAPRGNAPARHRSREMSATRGRQFERESEMAKDSYEEGMKVRRRVLGDAWVDRSLANRNDFNAEIGRQITSHVWGDIWTRPAIDLKTRRFMTLSIMIALRAWAEFRLHVRSGLATGDLTKDELKEIIMQATAYCGAPAGNHATHEAEEAFKEMAK
jgi:4-carboxymuconolactone decarboxylase